MQEKVDLVIIGAGWHGLAMAKTYLEAHITQKPSIIILDESASIGGCWASERLYDGLKTNNVVGSFEFSDFPMDLDRYGMVPGQHIPGEVVHRYLVDFAQHFKLDSLIRLQTKVELAALQVDDTWLLETSTCKSPRHTGRGQLRTRKLVIATGLTSEPAMPALPNREAFAGPILHAKELSSRSQDLKKARSVLVLGGNKSSWDAAYTLSRGGAQVHMVLRPSGGGPSRVWPARLFSLGSFRLTLARLSSTRLFTAFDPHPFGASLIRDFLHRTLLGRVLTSLFWVVLDFLVDITAGYHDPQVRMLRPWSSTFWMGNSLSVHNYETDWFELVRTGRIIVHHADVESLGQISAVLSNGQQLDSIDAVLCCTGWKCMPAVRFEPAIIRDEVGFPGAIRRQDKTLVNKMRKFLVALRPSLASTPVRNSEAPLLLQDKQLADKTGETTNKRIEQTGPYRLYRFLVPSSSYFTEARNLAFIGAHRSVHAVIVAQAQALWITAFFQRRLEQPLDEAHVRHETLLHTEYQRMRRPKKAGGSGGRYPDLVFDSIPYVDMLLGDLGVRTMRKPSYWANLFGAATMGDYKGLVSEWVKGKEVGRLH